MKGVIFAALLATTAVIPVGIAIAQTPPVPQPGAGASGPANICQELTAFLQPPTPAAAQANAPAATPAQQTAAAAPQQASGQGAAPAQPSAGGAQAGGQSATTTQPSGQGAPTASGISGPIPSGNTQGTTGPQAAGQNPAVTQPQGQAGQGGAGGSPKPAPAAQAAAPAAPAAPEAPKPTPAAIEKAQAAARDNNIAGCRGAAQEMRRAGVALPAPLIALAGLDLKYLQAAQPR
jgi:hypothetical protein